MLCNKDEVNICSSPLSPLRCSIFDQLCQGVVEWGVTVRAKAQRLTVDREPGQSRTSPIIQVPCLKHTLYAGATGLLGKNNQRRGRIWPQISPKPLVTLLFFLPLISQTLYFITSITPCCLFIIFVFFHLLLSVLIYFRLLLSTWSWKTYNTKYKQKVTACSVKW